MPPEAEPDGNLIAPAAPQTTPPNTTTPTPTAQRGQEKAPDKETALVTPGKKQPKPRTPAKTEKALDPSVPAVEAVSYRKCTCATPRIVRLEPATARRGDPVKIVGAGFGSKAVVRVNGKAVKTGGWTSERITFTATEAGSVVVDCGVESAPAPLELRPNAAPVAVIDAAPIEPGSGTFKLDSGASADPDGDAIKRRWVIQGRSHGAKSAIAYKLRGARKRAHARVRLTVADPHGKSASAHEDAPVRRHNVHAAG